MRSLLLLLLIPVLVSGQGGTKTDTILYSKILIIPYNPMMHLSDADDDIALYAGKNPQQVREQFRTGLTMHVDASLLTAYKTRVLQSHVGTDELLDLETIYGSVNYGPDTVYPVKYKTQKDTLSFTKKLFGKKEKTDPTYLNAKLSHPELLSVYSKKYGTDLFLFLNQLEIVTHATDCYDHALKTYRRELKVHYSLYDNRGRQVYGDVAKIMVPQGAQDIGELISVNFPLIGDQVLRSVPPKEIVPAQASNN